MFYLPAVKLRLSNGDCKVMDLPSAGDEDAVARRLFDEAAQAIVDEWKARRGPARGQRRDWLMRATYETMSLLLENGFQDLLSERIARFGRGMRGRVSENPFQRGLLALFAHDNDKLLTDGDRRSIGARMWYAYRHYVPSQFVAGFSMEYWSAWDAERELTGDVEPELLEWVIVHRASDERPQLRGTYSREIEEAARGARNILGPVLQIEGDKLLRKRRR